MKHHRLSLVVAALFLLVQLVGCGSGSSSGSSSVPAGALATTTSASPTPNLVVVPPVASATPGATIAFTTLNATGSATYAMSTNASGGSITSTGLYTAGPNLHTTDIIQVTDSGSGAIQYSSILVSPLVTVTPAAASVGVSGAVVLSATGGSGTGYGFTLFRNASGGAVSGSNYTAGANINSFDIVACADSASNLSFSIITVGSLLSINSGGALTAAPRGALALQGAGGSGQYTWFFVSNLSGGTLNQGTGAYTAGPNGGVSDVVMLLDSEQHRQVAVINVGATLSISPANPTVKTGNVVNFLTAGGSGSGLTWALTTNASGGAINATSGAYTAGALGGATDTVSVTDSLGNTATTNVTVTP